MDPLKKETDGVGGKHKKCPACAEKILIEAIKCKHCGEKISGNLKDLVNKTLKVVSSEDKQKIVTEGKAKLGSDIKFIRSKIIYLLNLIYNELWVGLLITFTVLGTITPLVLYLQRGIVSRMDLSIVYTQFFEAIFLFEKFGRGSGFVLSTFLFSYPIFCLLRFGARRILLQEGFTLADALAKYFNAAYKKVMYLAVVYGLFCLTYYIVRPWKPDMVKFSGAYIRQSIGDVSLFIERAESDSSRYINDVHDKVKSEFSDFMFRTDDEAKLGEYSELTRKQAMFLVDISLKKYKKLKKNISLKGSEFKDKIQTNNRFSSPSPYKLSNSLFYNNLRLLRYAKERENESFIFSELQLVYAEILNMIDKDKKETLCIYENIINSENVNLLLRNTAIHTSALKYSKMLKGQNNCSNILSLVTKLSTVDKRQEQVEKLEKEIKSMGGVKGTFMLSAYIVAQISAKYPYQYEIIFNGQRAIFQTTTKYNSKGAFNEWVYKLWDKEVVVEGGFRQQWPVLVKTTNPSKKKNKIIRKEKLENQIKIAKQKLESDLIIQLEELYRLTSNL